MTAKPLLTIEQEINLVALEQLIDALAKKALYVGIAKDSSGDKREDDGPNNHLLGYVHEFGSPINNIPARPFLVPGVKRQQVFITSKLKDAMRLALGGDARGCDRILEQLALSTAAGVRDYMSVANFEPLKPATIKYRNRSRLTQSSRQEEIDMDMSKIRPLINTGSLRNSVDGYFIEE